MPVEMTLDVYASYCLMMLKRLDEYKSKIALIRRLLEDRPDDESLCELPKIEALYAPIRRCANYRWN